MRSVGQFDPVTCWRVILMMSQFVVWQLRGVRFLCLRDRIDPFFLERIKRLPG